MLLFEIGYDQAEAVQHATCRHRGYEEIEVIQGSGRAGSGRESEKESRRNYMFDKLEDLLIRFDELLNMLDDPAVAEDPQRFQKLMKEQSRSGCRLWRPIRSIRSASRRIEDSLAMLEEESDEEMREMAKEELNDARCRIEELEQEAENSASSEGSE